MTICTERPRRALDRRSHAHHRGAGKARHRARRAAGAPALARSRRARREALRLPRMSVAPCRRTRPTPPRRDRRWHRRSGPPATCGLRSKRAARRAALRRPARALADGARAARRRAAPARPADRTPAPDPGRATATCRRAHLAALAQEMRLAHDRGLRGRDVLSPLRRREGRRSAAAADHRARLRDAVVPDGGRRRAARGAGASRGPTSASSARHASAAASTRRPRVVGRHIDRPRDDRRRSSARCARGATEAVRRRDYIDLAAYRAGRRLPHAARRASSGERTRRGGDRRARELRRCAASAAPAFRSAANGRSCAPSRRRG